MFFSSPERGQLTRIEVPARWSNVSSTSGIRTALQPGGSQWWTLIYQIRINGHIQWSVYQKINSHCIVISNCEISNLEEQQKLSMLKMSTNDSEKIGLKDTCHVFSCLLFRCKPNPQIVHIWKMHKKLWLVKVLIGAYQDTEDCRERPDTIGFVLTVITLTLRWNRRRTFN